MSAGRVLWAFLVRDFRCDVSYRLSFALQIASIVPVVLVFYFLARLIDGAPASGGLGGGYFPFVLVGLAIQDYAQAAMGGLNAQVREAQLAGTLEATLAAPVRSALFLAGTAVYRFAFSTFYIVLYLVFGGAILGAKLHWERLPEAVAVMALVIVAFLPQGVLAAAYTVVFKRGDPVGYLFNVAAWLLGGVYYPVEVLPAWLAPFSEVLPLTHALRVFRGLLVDGSGAARYGVDLAVLGAWAVAGVPVTVAVFAVAVRQARRKGSLGAY